MLSRKSAKVIVSRFLPRFTIYLTDSVITRAVTLDIPRVEEEEEEEEEKQMVELRCK